MTRNGRILSALICAAVTCSAARASTCLQVGPCGARAASFGFWEAWLVPPELLLAVATVVTVVIRVAHILWQTNRALCTLPLEALPGALTEARSRTQACRVNCIASDVPLAFCAGALSPQIYVSRGLVSHLRPAELDAVLLHERHHSRHRDPLRNAVVATLRDVGFFLPLLDWLAKYLKENAELRADRAAMSAVGCRPLAGALWALGSVELPPAAAAFVGAAELRVAQVLGDPLPRRSPSCVIWLLSGAGTVSCVVIVSCLMPALAR